MSHKALIALAVATALALFLAIFDPWEATPRPVLGRVLPPSFASSVVRLVVRGPQEERVEIQRGPDQAWRLVHPALGPAESSSVRQLVAALAMLRGMRREHAAPGHGLQDPILRVEYQLRSEEVGTLAIGAPSAAAQHRWVRRGESGPSLLVEAHLIEEILAAGSALPGRGLLAGVPGRGEDMRISGGGRWFDVHEGRVSWGNADSRQSSVRADVAALDGLRDQLRALRFDSFIAATPVCDPNTSTLVLEAAGERTEIRECGICGPTLVRLHVGDRGGCVAEQGYRDLQGLLRDPSSLVDLHVLPARQAVAAFSLRCAGEEMRVQAKDVDHHMLQAWWQALDSAAVSVAPMRSLQPLCVFEAEDWRVSFGNASDTLFAQVQGEATLRALRPESQALLRADPMIFLGKDLISEDPLFAVRIEVRGPDGVLTLQRGELVNLWHADDAAMDEEAASLRALKIASVLATFRAQRFASPAEQRAFASAKTIRQLTIDFEYPVDGSARRYLVRILPRASQCLVQVNDGPVAWLPCTATVSGL